MKKFAWVIIAAVVVIAAAIQLIRGGFGVKAPEDEYAFGRAYVDNIELSEDPAKPGQLQVKVRGSVADACTDLGELQTHRTDKIFTLALTTKRPKDAVCAQTPRPFEGDFMIVTSDLEPGEYMIDLNGVIKIFTIGE